MSNLYELTNDYETVLNMLYDEEIDEQMVLDTLESIEGEIEDKADGYAKIIKELLGDAEKIKAEKLRLEARQKAFENRAKLLRNNLQNMMTQLGKTKFKTELFSFGIQKNGGKLPLIINDISKVPEEYFKHTEKELNNTKIREDLEAGKELPFASFGEKKESLIIR